jgi:hypothetical protein
LKSYWKVREKVIIKTGMLWKPCGGDILWPYVMMNVLMSVTWVFLCP